MSWEIANNVCLGVAGAIFAFGAWCWFTVMFGSQKRH